MPAPSIHDIRLLAFDADDTLWDCQKQFDVVEQAYTRLLSPYASAHQVSDALFRTESGNMPLLGYGSKAFIISLVENAISVSEGRVSASLITEIIALGKRLLQMPATPLEGVSATLKTLKEQGRRMVVFTKGDNLEQEQKFRRSGLSPLFDGFVVVADKTEAEYAALCRRFGTDIQHLCMVGNSFKSDIQPVLAMGGWAIHIPYDAEWKHEHAEATDHPRLIRLQRFSQLPSAL